MPPASSGIAQYRKGLLTDVNVPERSRRRRVALRRWLE
jgi:hypothetical protein